MAILGYFRRRLFFKIGFVALIAIALGFLGYSLLNARRSSAALEEETRESSQRLAHGLVGGMQTAMIGGNGILVQDLIGDAQKSLPTVTIHVYDTKGALVFEPKGPIPAPASIPAPVRAMQTDPKRALDGALVYRPVPNEERCHDCHDAKAALRGTLAIELDGARAESKRDEILGTIITDAFDQVMTAKKTELLDGMFAELHEKVPSIREVGVYDAGGSLTFGGKPVTITDEWTALLGDAMKPGTKPFTRALADKTVRVVPMPFESRCKMCHEESEGPVRGAVLVTLERLAPAGASAELEGVIDTSLRTIMMSALGRLVTRFLENVTATHATKQLRLFDADGRLYYDALAVMTPPSAVAGALRDGQKRVQLDGDDSMTIVEPLRNDARCQRCHGTDQPLRGVIEIRASTERASIARREAMSNALRFGLITMVVVFALLWIALKRIVIDPVKRIGELAEQVEQGNLAVSSTRLPVAGDDEVARLASRMTQMVRGLRAKLHLEKFVSKGTAEAAGAASNTNTDFVRTGEKRTVTVLFTDIRGFTAYSERVSPEKVVSMLNRMLAAQAALVEKFGGDIDKFVGDELMALFHGDDGPARAVQCALGMIRAVEAARDGEEAIAVGAGISYGDVVYGAIGAESRMDFTVIGDVVNIGARLCSRAGGSEVLVSAAVHAQAGVVEGVAFESVEPLSLKGKSQPLETYRVTAEKPD